MFGPVRRVGEGLPTVRRRARVRALAGVRADVDLQVLQSGEGFATAWVLGIAKTMLKRLLKLFKF